jgi:hypothetical protein
MSIDHDHVNYRRPYFQLNPNPLVKTRPVEYTIKEVPMTNEEVLKQLEEQKAKTESLIEIVKGKIEAEKEWPKLNDDYYSIDATINVEKQKYMTKFVMKLKVITS